MKFELQQRTMFQGQVTGVSWKWNHWLMKMWLIMDNREKRTPLEYEIQLNYLLSGGSNTPGRMTPVVVEPAGPGNIRMQTKAVAPVLMLCMWLIKEFEPMPSDKINHVWAAAFLELGYKPGSMYVFPSVDQVAALYKEGAPGWKHLL